MYVKVLKLCAADVFLINKYASDHKELSAEMSQIKRISVSLIE